jgi:hypothetical protein
MDQVMGRRARSIPELVQLLGRVFDDADEAAGMAAYRARPTDLIISPYSKCGTTWLQQIVHALRTRGDEGFDDISRAVPWIETSVICGLDIEAPQAAEPRAFKSHLPYGEVPKGARYIVALREPKDACVSLYRFFEGWFLEPGSVGIDAFAQYFMRRWETGGGVWGHLLSWWAVRDRPDVCLLSYEHMNADPEAAIRRIAGFSGIALDEDLLAITLDRASLGYMKAHASKFDEHLIHAAAVARVSLPRGEVAKVRRGGAGAHLSELSADSIAALDTVWRRVVTPVTGCASYADLEAELRRNRV